VKLKQQGEVVLEKRFGMPDGEKKAQRDIAKMLGISRSYVSRIEKSAINQSSLSGSCSS